VKLLLTGDKHIRYAAPENRIDDFFEVQLAKEREMLEIAGEHDCQAILQPGDMFDSPNPPRYAMSRYIELYHEFGTEIFTVLGQHDTSMRNLDAAVKKTASYLLQSAGVIKIIGLDGKHESLYGGAETVCLHGLSFEQEAVPVPVEGVFNILMAHASVGDKPLFPGQALEGPREYARRHPGFDLILLGDYHYPYEDKWQNTDIINCGVSIRKTVDKRELEHKPHVIVYDTDTRLYTTHYLTIKPWNEVFRIPEKAEESSRLLDFINSLKTSAGIELSFASNLRLFYASNPVRSAVKDRIAEVAEKVQMPVEELKTV
jgi:DNA repair exonuclease SbcCD nuclease subunit